MRRYKGSLFCLVLAGLISALLMATDFSIYVGGNSARGLAVLQHLLKWLLVAPLGQAGAVGLVMAVGGYGALLCWPRK